MLPHLHSLAGCKQLAAVRMCSPLKNSEIHPWLPWLSDQEHHRRKSCQINQIDSFSVIFLLCLHMTSQYFIQQGWNEYQSSI